MSGQRLNSFSMDRQLDEKIRQGLCSRNRSEWKGGGQAFEECIALLYDTLVYLNSRIEVVNEWPISENGPATRHKQWES